MKLSTETIQILKNFSAINNSIVFNPGKVLTTMSNAKSVMGRADITEEIPSKFGIYDLSRFLGTISLFETPDIKIEETHAVISEGKKRITYTFTDPKLIITPPKDNIDLPDTKVEFDLTAGVFNEAMKSLSILSLPELGIVGDGEKIYIQAFNSKNPTGDVFSTEVGETEDTFKLIFNAENMKAPVDNYHVKISSAKLSHFKSDKAEYYIAVEGTSTFGD